MDQESAKTLAEAGGIGAVVAAVILWVIRKVMPVINSGLSATEKNNTEQASLLEELRTERDGYRDRCEALIRDNAELVRKNADVEARLMVAQSRHGAPP